MFSEMILKDAKSQPQTVRYKLNNGLLTLDDQEEALKDPWTAHYFAVNVPGADVEKCQEAACKDPGWAYRFAREVPGADIEKCQKAACKKPMYALLFGKDIPGADKEKCRKAFEGTEYAF